MAKEKVCLVTGAASTVGQHLLLHLIKHGYKVLALGEATDSFAPLVLQNRQIKVTTALPISAKQFKKYDVQFCFGDMSDISFLASVFATADKADIEIALLFHLSGNKIIQKSSPNAYHPDYGDTVNLLEVARAYWQEHKDVFKAFVYASDTGKRTAKQIEKLLNKTKEKDSFPAVIYHTSPVTDIVKGYTGRTSISSLYRVIMPFKTPLAPPTWKREADDDLTNIAGLKRATDEILAQIKANKTPTLD